MAGESASSVCRASELDSPGNKRFRQTSRSEHKRLFPGESCSLGFHRQYPRIQRNLRLRVLSFTFLRLNSDVYGRQIDSSLDQSQFWGAVDYGQAVCQATAP